MMLNLFIINAGEAAIGNKGRPGPQEPQICGQTKTGPPDLARKDLISE
jgi:hypothetical protein